mmetsp:Transcript_33428/g.84721  ORF Transcript_33428/g.84721 Transcript_33428/m.84721 type:complete len:374 (-) Transcript_33428:46-1167(-)
MPPPRRCTGCCCTMRGAGITTTRCCCGCITICAPPPMPPRRRRPPPCGSCCMGALVMYTGLRAACCCCCLPPLRTPPPMVRFSTWYPLPMTTGARWCCWRTCCCTTWRCCPPCCLRRPPPCTTCTCCATLRLARCWRMRWLLDSTCAPRRGPCCCCCLCFCCCLGWLGASVYCTCCLGRRLPAPPCCCCCLGWAGSCLGACLPARARDTILLAMVRRSTAPLLVLALPMAATATARARGARPVGAAVAALACFFCLMAWRLPATPCLMFTILGAWVFLPGVPFLAPSFSGARCLAPLPWPAGLAPALPGALVRVLRFALMMSSSDISIFFSTAATSAIVAGELELEEVLNARTLSVNMPSLSPPSMPACVQVS